MPEAEKKISWPFTKNAEDFVVYAPFGRYGTMYSVPDPYARYQIQLAYSSAYGAFWLPYIPIHVVGSLCHRQQWGRVEEHVAAVIYLVIIVIGFWNAARQSRGLKIASRRPSFLSSCKIASITVPAWQLWAIQMGAILVASGLVSMLHNSPSANVFATLVISGVLIPFASAVALVCSYVLHLKQLGVANTAVPS